MAPTSLGLNGSKRGDLDSDWEEGMDIQDPGKMICHSATKVACLKDISSCIGDMDLHILLVDWMVWVVASIRDSVSKTMHHWYKLGE